MIFLLIIILIILLEYCEDKEVKMEILPPPIELFKRSIWTPTKDDAPRVYPFMSLAEAIRFEKRRHEARLENTRQEAIHQESIRQEAIRLEQSRQEAIRLQMCRQEAIRIKDETMLREKALQFRNKNIMNQQLALQASYPDVQIECVENWDRTVSFFGSNYNENTTIFLGRYSF